MTILPNTDPSTWKLDDVSALLKNIIDLGLLLAGGIAVIYIIIGAYGYFTAFGSEERANKAKTTLTWAIIGVVVIILSKVIVAEVWKLLVNERVPF